MTQVSFKLQLLLWVSEHMRLCGLFWLRSRFSVSDSVRPQRRQPTRLPRPWDPPGKNTGVGCHCLLQCMKVKSESEVAQSCLTVSDLMAGDFKWTLLIQYLVLSVKIETGILTRDAHCRAHPAADSCDDYLSRRGNDSFGGKC